MPRAPTFLRATDAPAIRASLAMATLAHVSGRWLHACCAWLASRAVGAEDCCISQEDSTSMHQFTTCLHVLMLCVFSRGPVPHQQRRLQR